MLSLSSFIRLFTLLERMYFCTLCVTFQRTRVVKGEGRKQRDVLWRLHVYQTLHDLGKLRKIISWSECCVISTFRPVSPSVSFVKGYWDWNTFLIMDDELKMCILESVTSVTVFPSDITNFTFNKQLCSCNGFNGLWDCFKDWKVVGDVC